MQKPALVRILPSACMRKPIGISFATWLVPSEWGFTNLSWDRLQSIAQQPSNQQYPCRTDPKPKRNGKSASVPSRSKQEKHRAKGDFAKPPSPYRFHYHVNPSCSTSPKDHLTSHFQRKQESRRHRKLDITPTDPALDVHQEQGKGQAYSPDKAIYHLPYATTDSRKKKAHQGYWYQYAVIDETPSQICIGTDKKQAADYNVTCLQVSLAPVSLEIIAGPRIIKGQSHRLAPPKGRHLYAVSCPRLNTSHALRELCDFVFWEYVRLLLYRAALHFHRKERSVRSSTFYGRRHLLKLLRYTGAKTADGG